MPVGNGFKASVLVLAAVALAPHLTFGEETAPSNLAGLSNAELIEEYEAAGLALQGTGWSPCDLGTLDALLPMPGPDAERFLAAKTEITRRGAPIVPELIAFLEEEAPKERAASGVDTGLSFTGDMLDLLVEIGDPRTADIALRILERWDDRIIYSDQRRALAALKHLTCFSFQAIRWSSGDHRDCVEHPKALTIRFASTPDHFANLAELYRQWLEGDGRDPSRWHTMAVARAHQLLQSSDLDDVYCAATFLRPEAGRDNRPEVTMARLADFIQSTEKGTDEQSYTVSGKPVPVSIFNWVNMLVVYGPRARPYDSVLLRIQKEQDVNHWSGYAAIRKVGGPEIVAFLIGVLPEVSAEADKITSETPPGTGFSSDDPRLAWISSQREVRFGIDRWAGRLFDTDEERLAWWDANRSKPPEEWLRANLDTLLDQVDRNVLWARWIAQEVLPDLPADPRGGFLLPKGGRAAAAAPPREGESCTEWLTKHREGLQYDPDAGCFRLKP